MRVEPLIEHGRGCGGRRHAAAAAPALELRLFGELLLTDDAVEGSKAFAEKRPPNYQAR